MYACQHVLGFPNSFYTYLTGTYTDYEKARSDKNLSNTRSQDLINKERKHIEETIRKLQITASRDSSGKGSGMVASRKKKLARHGAEKDENGHKFKVQVLLVICIGHYIEHCVINFIYPELYCMQDEEHNTGGFSER
jgi:ATPase subunit of ABC transporter with duplicated ATPase domains